MRLFDGDIEEPDNLFLGETTVPDVVQKLKKPARRRIYREGDNMKIEKIKPIPKYIVARIKKSRYT
ncbi:MAG: hypothetical protein L6V79_03010 [Clostridium sp.]|nr:MAG: hypothetical protein L6V79_03010 [Clostridium sp.]